MNETFDGNSTFFRKGRYVEQLQAFTKIFRRDQIMILSSTGIFKNTQAIMENIRKFIGVKEHESFDVPLPHGKYVSRVQPFFMNKYLFLTSKYRFYNNLNNSMITL